MTQDKIKHAYEIVKKIQDTEDKMRSMSSEVQRLKGALAISRTVKTEQERKLKELFGGK